MNDKQFKSLCEIAAQYSCEIDEMNVRTDVFGTSTLYFGWRTEQWDLHGYVKANGKYEVCGDDPSPDGTEDVFDLEYKFETKIIPLEKILNESIWLTEVSGQMYHTKARHGDNSLPVGHMYQPYAVKPFFALYWSQIPKYEVSVEAFYPLYYMVMEGFIREGKKTFSEEEAVVACLVGKSVVGAMCLELKILCADLAANFTKAEKITHLITDALCSWGLPLDTVDSEIYDLFMRIEWEAINRGFSVVPIMD